LQDHLLSLFLSSFSIFETTKNKTPLCEWRFTYDVNGVELASQLIITVT
jgi:hypothetical protein